MVKRLGLLIIILILVTSSGCMTLDEVRTVVKEQLKHKVEEKLSEVLHEHQQDCAQCRNFVQNSL